jgi:hypothetical protein
MENADNMPGSKLILQKYICNIHIVYFVLICVWGFYVYIIYVYVQPILYFTYCTFCTEQTRGDVVVGQILTLRCTQYTAQTQTLNTSQVNMTDEPMTGGGGVGFHRKAFRCTII